MNFENYNKIYKEILDDESGELSANYLLNKYEIKHDEELLNILNQIKKNEYISSDNKIISRLISELDANENLLDINEIINIKDKVIDVENINLEDENVQDIETKEIIEDKAENSQNIINQTKNRKNYFIYLVPVIVISVVFFTINNDDNEKEINTLSTEKSITINNKDTSDNINNKITTQKTIETKDEIEKKEILVEENTKEVLPVLKKDIAPVIETSNLDTKIEEDIKNDESIKVNKNILEEKKELIKVVLEEPSEKEITKEVTKEEINKEIEKIIESNSTSEDALNKLEKLSSLNNNTVEQKNTIILKSLDEISKYKKQLKFKDNKIFFNGKYYSEKGTLFGFKIFKITPIYVKFEDQNKKIRKRFLFNK